MGAILGLDSYFQSAIALQGLFTLLTKEK